MAVQMTAQEARDDFAETLNRVAYGRARVLVQRRGKPVAAIVSVEDLHTLEAMAAREDAEDLAAHRAAMAEGGATRFAGVVAELGL